MANPARDARNHAQARWPGATVVSRGRNSITHQHPTDIDRFMFDTSVGPLHIEGTQTEIDTAIEVVAENGFQYRMVLADYHVHMRDVFNAGNIFEYRDPISDQWVIFDPQSINFIDENTSRQQIAIKQAVSAVVEDDVLRFPAGYGAGRHFQYQCQTGRLKKLITIDNLSDLPTPTVQGNQVWFEAEFSLSTSAGVTVWLDGVQWAKANGVRVQTSDRIEFRDSNGQQVFWHLDFPRAWDSNGNEVIGQMEVRRQGGPSSLFITVRIPYEWIQTAVFPIFIDPTIDKQVGAGSDDGYDEGAIGGGSTAIDVTGQFAWVNTASAVRTFYARFLDVTIPAGATIDAGTISELYEFSDSFDDPGFDVFGEDSATPATLTASAGNITGRTPTTASVNKTATGGGPWHSTGDISSIISELTASYDYSSGLNLGLMYEGNTSGGSFVVRTYEFDTSLAAKLHIEYTAGGGGGDLVVADASVVSQADAVVLTQVHNLVTADASVISQADNVVLTQDHNLTVDDASVTTQVDSVALTQVHNLIVDDASVVTQSDNATLTQVHNLTMADASSVSQTDNVALTQVHNLTVADASVVTVVDTFALVGTGDLDVQDAFVTTQTDAVVLTQVHNLTVADASVTSQVDATALTQVHNLTIDDASVVSQSDNATLTQVHNLVVADASVVTQADAISLSGAAELVVADAFVTSQVDAVTLTQVHVLVVADAHNVSQADTVTLTQVHNLQAADAYVVTQTDNVVIVSGGVVGHGDRIRADLRQDVVADTRPSIKADTRQNIEV